jgi:hypothetical protein
MKIWIGVALVAAAQAFSAPAAVAATSGAAEAKAKVATSNTTDVSARRIHRRHPASPAYVPTYYARPYYYRPYPYDVPVPFFLGFGYLPYY